MKINIMDTVIINYTHIYGQAEDNHLGFTVRIISILSLPSLCGSFNNRLLYVSIHDVHIWLSLASFVLEVMDCWK